MKCSDTVLDILILDSLKQRLYVIPPAVKINGECEVEKKSDNLKADESGTESHDSDKENVDNNLMNSKSNDESTETVATEDTEERSLVIEEEDERFSLHDTVCR